MKQRIKYHEITTMIDSAIVELSYCRTKDHLYDLKYFIRDIFDHISCKDLCMECFNGDLKRHRINEDQDCYVCTLCGYKSEIYNN